MAPRPASATQFRAEVEATIARIRAEGMETMGGQTYARGPTRLVFEEKDPRGYAEFRAAAAASIRRRAPR